MLFHGTTFHGAQPLLDRRCADQLRRRSRSPTFISAGRSQTVEATRRRGEGSRASPWLGSVPAALPATRAASTGPSSRSIPKLVRIARDPDFQLPVGLRADRCRSCSAMPGSRSRPAGASTSLFIDAFSSDAIPVHLLTREAVTGYLSRWRNGVIVMHISNRHMELGRVVAAVGAAEGLVKLHQAGQPSGDHAADYKSNAIVVVLTRDPANLGNLPKLSGWRRLAPDPRSSLPGPTITPISSVPSCARSLVGNEGSSGKRGTYPQFVPELPVARIHIMANSQDEIRGHEGFQSRQLNLKVGAQIAIDVAFDKGVASRLEPTQLACGSKGCVGGGQEREGRAARARTVGIDSGEIDVVADAAGGEVRDDVAGRPLPISLTALNRSRRRPCLRSSCPCRGRRSGRRCRSRR